MIITSHECDGLCAINIRLQDHNAGLSSGLIKFPEADFPNIRLSALRDIILAKMKYRRRKPILTSIIASSYPTPQEFR
jgi:hypothetical protein